MHPAVRKTAAYLGMTTAAYPWIQDLQEKLEASGRSTDIFQEAVACKGWVEANLPPEKHVWSIRLPNWITSTIEKGPTPMGRGYGPDPELTPREETGVPVFDRLMETYRTKPVPSSTWDDLAALWARPVERGVLTILHPFSQAWMEDHFAPLIEIPETLQGLGFTGSVVYQEMEALDDHS